MNKEEFYDQLNSLIEELTIDYAQKLRGTAEDILKQLEANVITADEVSEFLREQEKMFADKLESTIDDLEEKIQRLMEENEGNKKNIIQNLKSSFGKIFESIVQRLSRLFE